MRRATMLRRGGGQGGSTGRRLGKWAGALGAVAALVAVQAGPAAVAAPGHATSPAGAVVISSRQSSVGRILIDSTGFSLYEFSGDGASPTACLPTNVAPNGLKCTDAWPPVMASGPLVAGPGVNQHGLGKMNRPGIGLQVTYFGQPLYRFVLDGAAGQTKGQDVTSFLGFWRLMSAAGLPAADRASVRLEMSANGAVLDTPTAFGTTRSLYHLSFDPSMVSTCGGGCAAFWPPLLTDTMPLAGPGVNRSALGFLRRSNGSLQVTYFGKPLYLFAFDLGAFAPSGQTNGNNLIAPGVQGVWDTLSADGLPVPGAITVGTETSGSQTLLATPATVGGGTTATLYAFSTDTSTTTTCTGTCARFWPPLLTSQLPVAGAGADPTKLGTIQRPDGSFQISYAGHPLYLFAFRLDPTTAGEGIVVNGGTFQVLGPDGVPH